MTPQYVSKWVVASTDLGGPLYCPTDPYGIVHGQHCYMWAPWTPLLEFAKRFDSEEAADEFMISLVLEGFPAGNQIVLRLGA